MQMKQVSRFIMHTEKSMFACKVLQSTHVNAPNASSTVLASRICCSVHRATLHVTVHRYCKMNFVVSVCKQLQEEISAGMS